MLKYPISGRNTGESIRDTERDNLYISWDEEDGFVMLFTPSMLNTDTHYHIELSPDQAARLTQFLERQFFDIRKKKGDWKRAIEILDKAPDVEPPHEDRII